MPDDTVTIYSFHARAKALVNTHKGRASEPGYQAIAAWYMTCHSTSTVTGGTHRDSAFSRSPSPLDRSSYTKGLGLGSSRPGWGRNMTITYQRSTPNTAGT